MRFYLAGPMSVHASTDHNFSQFTAVAKFLRNLGFDVLSPHEIEENDFRKHPGVAWDACMRRDIVELLKCEGIFLLPDWEKSRGATIEAMIAYLLGMDCVLVLINGETNEIGWKETSWPVARLLAGFINNNIRLHQS